MQLKVGGAHRAHSGPSRLIPAVGTVGPTQTTSRVTGDKQCVIVASPPSTIRRVPTPESTLRVAPTETVTAVTSTPAGQLGPRGDYSGVWLSRYEYFSSGRNATFTGQHYVTLLQHGDRLTVRSLPGSADSSLTLDLTVDGNVVTGTWVEQTEPESYYRGARYHGSIQMLAEPTGRRMTGKWVGFGKNMDINTGPWELIFQDASTNKATLERYNRPPTPEA